MSLNRVKLFKIVGWARNKTQEVLSVAPIQRPDRIGPLIPDGRKTAETVAVRAAIVPSFW